MNLEHEIKQTISRLRALDRRIKRGRKRFGSYRYLCEVYHVYADWRARRIATEAALIILEMEGAAPQIGTHPLRVLIDATSKASATMKSRFTLALRYIWRRRHEWNDFFAFVHRSGGIAGCAADMTIFWPSRHVQHRQYYYPDTPRKRWLALDRRRGCWI